MPNLFSLTAVALPVIGSMQTSQEASHIRNAVKKRLGRRKAGKCCEKKIPDRDGEVTMRVLAGSNNEGADSFTHEDVLCFVAGYPLIKPAVRWEKSWRCE